MADAKWNYWAVVRWDKSRQEADYKDPDKG